MRVCVAGLGRSGVVAAACFSRLGHDVRALDPDRKTVESLRGGSTLVAGKEVADLLVAGISKGRLLLTDDPSRATDGAEILWVADGARAAGSPDGTAGDAASRVYGLFPSIPESSVVIFAMKQPAGTIRRVDEAYNKAFPNRNVHFACCHMGIRGGETVDAFLRPEKISVGIRSKEALLKIQVFLSHTTASVEWMSVESAEMTRHASNVFAALSTAFSNEIARICESVGADASEVIRGVKASPGVGQNAYLLPGLPFSNPSLDDDVAFLSGTGGGAGVGTHLICAVKESNDRHERWVMTCVAANLPSVAGNPAVAVWGLPCGTPEAGSSALLADRLRRALSSMGASVRLYIPGSGTSSAVESAAGADALVILGGCQEYASLDAAGVLSSMRGKTVVDPLRVLKKVSGIRGVRYFAVGFSGKGILA